MYDELIKWLRVLCESCKLWDGYKCCLKGECSAQKRLQAADAIEELLASCDNFEAALKDSVEECEELQKQLREEKVDNVNLTGWLAEEHAKHLWIPVTERLPEGSGHYLIYVVGGEFKQWSMVTMAYYHKKFYYDDMEDNFDQITHWMPLPQPPKEET